MAETPDATGSSRAPWADLPAGPTRGMPGAPGTAGRPAGGPERAIPAAEPGRAIPAATPTPATPRNADPPASPAIPRNADPPASPASPRSWATADYADRGDSAAGGHTITTLYLAAATADGDQPAIIDFASAPVSYAALDIGARRIAAALKNWGIGRGHLVGLLASPSADYYCGLLGIIYAGAAYLPLDPADSFADTVQLLAAAQPAAVVLDDWVLAERTGLLPVIGLTDPALADLPFTEAVTVEPGDLACCLMPPGSPGALISHQAITNLVANCAEDIGVSRADKILAYAHPAEHTALWEWGLALLSGASLRPVPVRKRQDVAWLNQVLASQVSFAGLTPATLARLQANREADPAELAAGKSVWGPAPAPAGLRALIIAGLPDELPCFAGQVAVVAGLPYHLPLTCWPRQEPLPEVLPLGRPLRGVRAYVTNDQSPVQPGESGELILAGAGVGLGYLRPAVDDPYGPGPNQEGLCFHTGWQVRWQDGQLLFDSAEARHQAQAENRPRASDTGDPVPGQELTAPPAAGATGWQLAVPRRGYRRLDFDAGHDDAQTQAEWWQSQQAALNRSDLPLALSQAPGAPADRAAALVRASRQGRIPLGLDVQQTVRLLESPRAYTAEVADLIVAAVVWAVHDVFGLNEIVMALARGDRTYPVAIEAGAIVSADIIATKEALRAVPDEEPAAGLPQPHLAVRYRTSADGPGDDVPNPVLVNTVLTKGRLAVDLEYAVHRLDDATAWRFGLAVIDGLHGIIEHSAAQATPLKTPSDVGADGIDETTLTELNQVAEAMRSYP